MNSMEEKIYKKNYRFTDNAPVFALAYSNYA